MGRYTVDHVRWNPNNPNELAVCSERANTVHLYDLGDAGGMEVTSPTRVLPSSTTHGVVDIAFRPGLSALLLSCYIKYFNPNESVLQVIDRY
jgi:hypothetical protein